MKRSEASVLLILLFLIVACDAASPAPTETDVIAPPAITKTPILPPLTTATAATTSPPSPSIMPTAFAAIVRELPEPAVSLAADPSDPRSLYALLATDTLYHTVDAGQTWQRILLPVTAKAFTPPPNPDKRNDVFIIPQQDLRIARAAPNHLWLLVSKRLLHSEDRGATWHVIQDDVQAWASDETQNNILYAWRPTDLAETHGLYRSSDGGYTWQSMYTGYFPPGIECCIHEGITSLLIDPASASVLYAGTDHGVYRSRDSGKTWSEFNAGMPATKRVYRWVPILTATGKNVFAVSEISTDGMTQQAVLLRLGSANGQPEWMLAAAQITAGLTQGIVSVHTLVSDQLRPDWLYLGTDTGLYFSMDAGQNWKPIKVPGVHDIYRIAVAQAVQTTLYLWTERGLVVADLAV
jgi:hypothetical protein